VTTERVYWRSLFIWEIYFREICSVRFQRLTEKMTGNLSYFILFYYKSRKREVKTRLIYEDRYEERLKKLKMRNLLSSHTLGCVIPAVIHT
jgi:hypothetical protein